ncbi:hypothetical protein M231_05478 [Tremella mesenterica]|uniref:Uncharacterized protein n=1 Tax=Tremella mesenterica TaxID=5217 RepID=A0A4V1M3L2_TREME|nr:hypothetical protein M231_05478 [Tremella mesenterica]
MTHMTPTVLLFACCLTVLSFGYFLFHSWNFDKFQSLIPTKRRAFKVGIAWSLIFANICFASWNAALAYFKYTVGYTDIPGLGNIPTPYQLWPQDFKNATIPLYYFLALAFTLHLSIQTEETCYWIHLVKSIRGITTSTWVSSLWFKIWVMASLAGAAGIFGAVIPFDDDPQAMELHIFTAGSIYSALFTLSSVYVIWKFPALIDSVRSQGGSRVVIERLKYHRRLTQYRMVSRVIFVACFLVCIPPPNTSAGTNKQSLSIDGFTPEEHIAHDPFGTDLLLMVGAMGLVGSSIISVYMFFPPDQPLPSIPDSRSLLGPQIDTFDSTTSLHYHPSLSRANSDKYSKPIIMVNPPSSGGIPRKTSQSNFGEVTREGRGIPRKISRPRLGEMTREEAEDWEREREIQQITSQISVVAPFATPPTRSIDLPRFSTDRRERPRVDRERRGSSDRDGDRVGRNSKSNNNSTSDLSDAEKAREAQNQYAWSLLADHLRLPEDAMGLISEATEMNRKAWRAAQRAAQDIMVPPNLRQHYPPSVESREVLEVREHEVDHPLGEEGRGASTMHTERKKNKEERHQPPATSRVQIPMTSFRSLPPPLRRGPSGSAGPTPHTDISEE